MNTINCKPCSNRYCVLFLVTIVTTSSASLVSMPQVVTDRASSTEHNTVVSASLASAVCTSGEEVKPVAYLGSTSSRYEICF